MNRVLSNILIDKKSYYLNVSKEQINLNYFYYAFTSNWNKKNVQKYCYFLLNLEILSESIYHKDED